MAHSIMARPCLIIFLLLRLSATLGFGADRFTFGIVGKDGSPEYKVVLKGATDEARNLSSEKGVRVEIVSGTPKEMDATAQVEAMRYLVRIGVDGIAVSPVDANALKSVIKEADDAKIKVVVFESDVPESKRIAYVCTDDLDCGVKLFSELAKEIHDNGVVAILGGIPNDSHLSRRVQGVKSEASQHLGIKIQGIHYCSPDPMDAYNTVAQVWSSNPAINGWGLVVNWGEFDRYGFKWEPGKIVVAVVDPSVENDLALMERGYVQVILVQNYYEWGMKCVNVLYNKVAENKDPEPPVIPIKVTPLRRDRLEEFKSKWREWSSER
jgi:ribose transport system substrate-binding protein